MKRALLLGGFAAAVAIAVACGDADVYIYTARKYEAAGACLDAYEAIDQIHGDGANATCAPACFAIDDATYVSTVCPPLPADAVQIPGNSPECIAASQLLDASCSAEAGAVDAGHDVDAGATPAVLDASDDGG